VFYAVLLPLLVIFKEFLGLANEVVFNIIQLVVFLFVYGFVAIFIEVIFKRMNDRLLFMRKANGGRDIAAEERHEDESSGLISLSISDKK
jgi:hypothetical protein